MKIFLSVFSLLFIAPSAFAYQSWRDYTPRHIFSSQRPITRNVTLQTKGMINSCGGMIEGNRYRVEVISCSERSLDVKIEYRNRVDCDMGEEITETFRVDVPSGCEFGDYPGSKIVINGHEFLSH